MKAYVLGNGPSRQAVDLTQLPGLVFGCNAIYRDFRPHYVVAIDAPMIKELREQTVYPQWRVIVPPVVEHWEPPELHNGQPHVRRSNAGVNAVIEACRRDCENIFLLGFDFLITDPEQATANIYDGTDNYGMEVRAKAEDSAGRAAYLNHVMKTVGFGLSFVIVLPTDVVRNKKYIKLNAPNQRVITMDAFISSLKGGS